MPDSDPSRPRFRYYRDAALGPAYERAMDELFGIYAAALPRVVAWAQDRYPRAPDEPEAAHTRALRAKALDLLRGLLPASSLSHMGIYASGQTYEQLILHLLAHPAARGAQLRDDDPRGAAGGDAELPDSRAAP